MVQIGKARLVSSDTRHGDPPKYSESQIHRFLIIDVSILSSSHSLKKQPTNVGVNTVYVRAQFEFQRLLQIRLALL